MIYYYFVCKRELWYFSNEITMEVENENSVFEGEITKVQLAKLQQELKPYVDKEYDSIIIFKCRQEKWLDKEFWGKKEDKTSFFL